MIKVITLVGTRPELIKMSRVIAEFDKYTNHILVHSGQSYDYELNQIFFDDLTIRKPDHFLNISRESAAQAIGEVIIKFDALLQEENPDALLLYGDTNTCLAVIAAKRRKVPVFHMEAGNRCFDQCVPEELNRKVVDHLSDINMVLTEHARRYLIQEGIAADTIIKTGSHMREVLDFYQDKINASNVLTHLNLEKGHYFVVSAHREENVDEPYHLLSMMNSLNFLAEKYKYPIIFSTHPRTSKKLEELDFVANELISFVKPLGFFDYIQLQKNAFCVLSDSGTITEEASLLNFPAITIRNAHERPEGMDKGVLIMSGLKEENIDQAVRITTEYFSEQKVELEVDDYRNEHVSKQILKVVLSYIDFVNRRVWKKI